jgi:ornithine cyclodeaminase
MPLAPLALNADDFADLFTDPKYMIGAMAAVEAAFVADQQRKVRAGSFGDVTEQGSLRFNLVGGQGKLDSVLALGAGGGVNSRFVMLFDGVTRELVALLDSGLLNPLRVGAEAGVAVKYLAAPAAKVAACIGTGRQAVTQVAALVNALPSLEVTKVYSPTEAHRVTFCHNMSAWLNHRFEPVDSVAQAIDGADIVDLINPSHAPLFETPQLKPGALVLAMSGRGEIPLDFLTLPNVRVVAPSWEILSVSPVREPFPSAVKEGRYSREDYACDLGDVIVNGRKARNEPSDIVDFEGTAMPVLEHAATEWAYDWARANGVGTTVRL